MAEPLLNIRLKAPPGLKRGVARAPAKFQKTIHAFLWEADLLLEREVKERTPVGIGAGGGLRGSIAGQEPRSLGDSVIGVVSSSMLHAVPVELGTKPHMPPVQPLVEWAAHKFNLGPDEAERAGFLIARKIAAKGTKGAFMFKKAMEENEGQLTDRLGEYLEGFLDEVGGRA